MNAGLGTVSKATATLQTSASAPKKFTKILKEPPANREVGAGQGRQNLWVTNFDNAFVPGSKVKYGHTNPLLPEFKHKGRLFCSLARGLFLIAGETVLSELAEWEACCWGQTQAHLHRTGQLLAHG